MGAEFDIFGGFIDDKALTAFEDLEKQAKKTAESMAKIAAEKDKIFGSSGKSGSNKTQENLVAALEKENAKLRTIQEKHQNAMLQLETKLQNQIALMKEKAIQKEEIASKRRIKAREDELIAFQNAQSKENTLDEIAAQKRISRDAKILMQKQESEQRILAMQQAAADKKAAREAAIEAKEQARLKREEDRLNKKIAKEQAAADKIAAIQAKAAAREAAKLTPEQKATASVANSNTAAVLKLNAIAADANSTALQKMYAQMKLLEIEMQSKFNPALTEQSAEFRKLNAEHARLQAEYQRTARATGVMGRQMNSMYGSTFQLTQVMRELPNFAIDARVGFMALSNNLPMLADSFKQLKQQIIDTEGAAGASRKTWAAFGKSLLSLNTIMIVASTLLVLFGDDIVEFGSKLFKGQDAADKFTLSMKAMLKAATDMSGAAASSIEKIEKLGAQIRTYKEGVDDAQAIVKDFNETFGTHLTTINQVKVAYGEMAKAAIDGAIKMQAAMDLISQSSKQVLRGQNASLILSNFSEQQTSEMESRLDKYFNAIRERMKKAGADEQQIIKATNAEAENLKKGYFGATRTGNVILDAILGSSKEDEIEKHFGKIGKNSEMMIKAILNKRAADVAVRELRKSIDEIMPDTKADPTKPTNPKNGTSKKTFTDINVTREYYQAEEVMLKRLADLEKDITKENENGVLNSYEKRKKAAELYYETTERLAEQDKFVQITNEKLKTQAAKKAIQEKYENNVRKFGKNSKEAIQSAGELSVGNATLEANERDAILKINDDFTKKILSATKKRTSDLYAINKDMYDDEVYLIQQKEKIQLMFAGQGQTSGFDMALGLFGVKKDKSFETGNREREIKRQSLLSQLTDASGDQEKDIWRSLKELDKEDIAQAEIELIKSTESSKADVVENSIETLKSLWDSYYKYLEDKIDENLKKQTKVNDERIAQYEDEAKAGKHSAKEVSDFKDNISVYQQAQEEEAARRKKELEKEQFIVSQAFALAKVWIEYAIANQAIISAGNMMGPLAITYVPAAQAWNLASAIAGTALIAAQTIPAFEKGGLVENDTWAKVSEKRQEYGITKEGKIFLTPKTPSLMYLEKGTTIYPDAQKMDLDSFNLMNHGLPMIQQDDRLLDEVKQLNRNLSRQKPQPINGLRLMQQLQYNQKIISNRKSLLN